MPTTQITYNVTKEYAEELFGLTSEYTLGDLRTAFRKLAVECHPDMAENEADLIEREARSRIVNMSYARLKKQFVADGETSVKPLSEIIMESKESGGDSCDDGVFDDILDFLDDIDNTADDGWQAMSQHSVKGEQDGNASAGLNDMPEKAIAADPVNYSLPPFLRRRYLRSPADIDDIGNGNNHDCKMGNDIDSTVIGKSPVKTRPDIEDEVDRIMASILRKAGCI